MSSEKKDEPAKLHTNLLALPPQTSPAFQIKVTFFEIMCHYLLQNVFFFFNAKIWEYGKRRRRKEEDGQTNGKVTVIVTQTLNSLGSSISLLTVVLSVPMAR